MDRNETSKMLKTLATCKESPPEACARDLELETRIIELHKRHERGVLNVLRAREHQNLVEYLNGRFPMLNDPRYSLGMKIYWLENGILDFPLCCNREHGDHKNTTNRCSLGSGYHTIFCCSKCEATSEYQQKKREETKDLRYGDPHYHNQAKAEETRLKKTGYANPFSDPRVIKKMVAKKKAAGDYGNHAKMVKTKLEKIRPEWRHLSWGARKLLETLERAGAKDHLEAREYSARERTKLSWKLRTYRIMKERWKLFEPLFTIDEWIDADKFKDDLPWRCKKCGNEFKSYFNSHYPEYHRCLKCNPLESAHSKIELEMQEFIEGIHPHPSYDRNTKHVISPVELDDYVRDLKLGFEMDGIYTHLETFKKPGYHTYKTKRCDEVGIHLIHIFEDEWKHYNELCKSNIAKALGDRKKHVEVIDASSCDLVELPFKEASRFFEANSIRWSTEVSWDLNKKKSTERASKIYKIYGLKRKDTDELVFACIVLKNRRLSFDLFHFSERAFTVVDGALETIVAEVSKDAKTITCNLDKRWYLPQEKMTLSNLGFKLRGMFKASFFWVNYGYDFRYHQLQVTREFILEDQKRMFGLCYRYNNKLSLTENLAAGKCAKIYNAGQQHWILHVGDLHLPNK